MKIFDLFSNNSPEYVIAHAAYRVGRGKKPSVSYKGINNPRVALAEAKKEFCSTTVHFLSFMRPVTVSILEKVNRVLGLRGITLQEAEKLLQQQISDDRGYAPFLSWENGRWSVSSRSGWHDDWSSSERRLFIRP